MNHWSLVKAAAEIKYHTNEEWTSFVHKRRYAVLEVRDNGLIIEKRSGGNQVWLPEVTIQEAAEKLRKNGSLLKTNLISGSVAREAAIIALHPCIHLDQSTYTIRWKEGFIEEKAVEGYIEEASDGDVEKIEQWVRRRKYQSQFRANLLKVYNSKCCITDCNVEDVLEAAHIMNYASSLNNKNDNGLLLRADFHALFDRNLLIIHPHDLKVHLSPDLRSSHYAGYHGKRINAPKQISLSSNLLQRWNKVEWTIKIN